MSESTFGGEALTLESPPGGEAPFSDVAGGASDFRARGRSFCSDGDTQVSRGLWPSTTASAPTPPRHLEVLPLPCGSLSSPQGARAPGPAAGLREVTPDP